MPGNRKKGTASGPNGTPDDMQNRIDRLENLVLSLMTNGAQAPGAGAAQAAIQSSRSNSLSTSADQRSLDVDEEDMIKEDVEGEDSDVNEVANGIGLIKVDNGKTFFASDAHWYAILHDVSRSCLPLQIATTSGEEMAAICDRIHCEHTLTLRPDC